MSAYLSTEVALSIWYQIKLDGWDVGAFTHCTGLGAEVVTETREEGGNNEVVWTLPTRLRYPNITLTRPLGKDSERVAPLFARMVTEGYRPGTATIVAMTADGTEVARWGLLGVVPVRWTGPQLAPEDHRVVTETLEIAHHGFTSPGAG